MFAGAYCVLFGVSIYVLFKRKRPDLKLHLSPIVVLFIFVNAGMLCNVISLGRDLSHPGSTISTGQMGIDSISLRLMCVRMSMSFMMLINTSELRIKHSISSASTYSSCRNIEIFVTCLKHHKRTGSCMSCHLFVEWQLLTLCDL